MPKKREKIPTTLEDFFLLTLIYANPRMSPSVISHKRGHDMNYGLELMESNPLRPIVKCSDHFLARHWKFFEGKERRRGQPRSLLIEEKAEVSKSPYPSWQRRHEAVLQFILQNPAAKRDQCAAATGYSEWQISRITRSPEFQRKFKRLADEKYERIIEQKYEKILGEHMDRLEKILKQITPGK